MTISISQARDSIASVIGRRELVEHAITLACARIAPLWPLKTFVAVNPFLGFADQSFETTCATFRRVAQIEMLMPRSFYRQSLDRGYIEDCDLQQALGYARFGGAKPSSPAELRYALAEDRDADARPQAMVATVAEILDRLADGDRQVSRTGFMIDEISKWCGAYFDEGQAAWQLPTRNLRPYPAWRATMRHDRNPEAMGISQFRQTIAALPDTPIDAIEVIVDALGIPDRAVGDYLLRGFLDIAGWAGYASQLVWNNRLHGRPDDTLVHLLAIRMAWGYALFQQRKDSAFRGAWTEAMAAAAEVPGDSRLAGDRDVSIELLVQHAYEAAYQRRLIAQFTKPRVAEAKQATRKSVQAAFCIDVRSEVYRRALETVWPQAETIGFAGFFGFPIEYVPIGHQTGGAQCPVLLTPSVTVCEAVKGADPAQEAAILDRRVLRRRAAKAWKSFKSSAVSSFAYVEINGLLFAGKIASDGLGLTRPVSDPNTDGLDAKVIGRIGPRIEPRDVGGRPTGFDRARRIAMAEAVLRAMSLTSDFARLIMLTGHGSTTVNNPHAASLNCGACGGHTGEANARVAAGVLNDAAVRIGLKAKSIDIPDDTWFLACLHDTTTDEIEIFDQDQVPESHRGDLVELRSRLEQAGKLARTERAASLGLSGADDRDAMIKRRSRDWSQVRPEWGLAGNSTFIAAPRARTASIAFAGRAFLHSYDWQQDHGFGVLELIMTAPMVVASWINLQYYGSAVNNRAFGSGNKALHNVAGLVGVLEGNAGDLRPGLPWQSVHDGKRLIHEPLRLNVFIEAPLAAINAIIAKHEAVRQLTDNGWLHLFALGDDGRPAFRYLGDLTWVGL